MEITFYGVRGSIASPGAETSRYGGNTSCVEVRCGRSRLVLDAGTGLRRLGDAMMASGSLEATLLLSHYHWDHIQGLPFFVPAYVPGARLRLIGMEQGKESLRAVLERQMQAPNFPVRFGELRAALELEEVRPGDAFALGEVRVRTARLNHPGGVVAYRVEHAGASVVYATDTEHWSCVDPALLDLARGADVLIYDAQYTPDEYARSKVGWGHSTYEAGAAVARAAGVGRLVLFHHDPSRTDEGVAELERRAQALFPASVAAREGMALRLEEVLAGPASARPAAAPAP